MQADKVVADGKLGEDYGAGLTEREVAYFTEHEWARSAEDVLWRQDEMRPADERGAKAARGAGHGPMKPLAQLDARAIDALLFDIDETLTTEGKLTAQAYAALEKLQRGGQARRRRHRPAGGLVRPHRAHVAGGRGGRRERRLLLSACRGQAAQALRRRREDPCGEARSPRCDRQRRSSSRCRAAPSPPTSPTARPTLRSTTARTSPPCRSRRPSASLP